MAELKFANEHLNVDGVTHERSYDVNTATFPYRNHIINIPPLIFDQTIQRGKAIILMASKNLFEHVDMVQCKKCWRFGHLHHGCNVPEICRRCADHN